MSHASAFTPSGIRRHKGTMIACVAAVLVLVGIALDTKVVKHGSAEDVQEQGFSPEKYGTETFPKIQHSVEQRAVDAKMLFSALKADSQQATEKYGVGTPMAVFPVTFSGVVGEGKKGIYSVQVNDMPASFQLRLQTGPVVTGTDLRDATGEIQFGDFKNQIEYQNAGSALNQAMKQAVLDKVDGETLSGKTVKVTGVFRLLNPDNWLVTPVRMEIQ
jgi:predicted lipoprotein